VADRLVVRCLVRDQAAHVEPVERSAGDRMRFVYDTDWEPTALVLARPDAVLCVNDWPAEIARCLDAARAAGIPSLVLQDGVLEWRCQYENPLFAGGGGAPQHQPVLADKIACIGASSARHLASWGNETRVEITGMPRLDFLEARRVPAPASPGRRVLVMTAKKAGFSKAQVAVTLQSLQDVRMELARREDLEVRWRVARDLAPALAVTNELRQLSGGELAEQLAWADAVITTPSTALLETMLLDRPVACLDYHNTPRFVPTAWTISAPVHIAGVVDELLRPPATKMAFQRECLADAVACRGRASECTVELIDRLVAWARSRVQQSTVVWLPPAGMLPVPQGIMHRPPPLAELYPDQPVFAEADPIALQVRIARLQHDNDRLRRELARHSIRGRVASLGRYLSRRLLGSTA
jgi:hypothetical protein